MRKASSIDPTSSPRRRQDRNAREQLQRRDNLAALANGIAHDFNNLLTPINGYLQLVQNKFADHADEQSEIYYNNIRTCLNRAEILVEQILLLSRASDGSTSELLLHLLIEEVVALLQSSLPSTIQLSTRLDRKLSPVEGNAVELQQLLLSLGTNAAIAMPTGGELEFSLRGVDLQENDVEDLSAGSYARLEIRDTRAEAYSELDGKGLTALELGLSVSLEAARRHGGQLIALNKAQDGTIFRLFLPVKPATRRKKEEGQHRGTERVLFLDDEYMICAVTQEILENHGYKVEARQDSSAALERFRLDPDSYDIIITDETMPRICGHRFAAEVKKIRPDIPIVLCSGSKLTSEQMSFADTHLKKPISSLQLLRTIRDVLDVGGSSHGE